MSILPQHMGFHFLGHVAMGVLALALIYGTAVPLFPGNAWWIRIFDFPRIQIAVLIGLTLIGYAVLHLYGSLRTWEYALAAGVGLALFWQLYSIAPYTVLYPREMADSRAEDNSNRLSLLVYNVLADNRDVDALRHLIRDTNPDMILLSEPTPWWLEQLDGLKDDYPFTLLQPQENRYGLLLYSRLELEHPEIRFLIEPEIPSVRTDVQLRSGTVVTLYGVHPRPPGIKRPEDEEDRSIDKDEEEEDEESERADSTMRDAELLLVAKEIKKLGNVPVIVAGDFNDVAWSHTTHLFQRVGGLLDPRVGRGLFNSFDTRSRLLRFPLDHVFASRHFLLVELRRLPNIGSDHFPIFVVLDYDPNAASANEEPQPNPGDAEEVAEAIEDGKTED